MNSSIFKPNYYDKINLSLNIESNIFNQCAKLCEQNSNFIKNNNQLNEKHENISDTIIKNRNIFEENIKDTNNIKFYEIKTAMAQDICFKKLNRKDYEYILNLNPDTNKNNEQQMLNIFKSIKYQILKCLDNSYFSYLSAEEYNSIKTYLQNNIFKKAKVDNVPKGPTVIENPIEDKKISDNDDEFNLLKAGDDINDVKNINEINTADYSMNHKDENIIISLKYNNITKKITLSPKDNPFKIYDEISTNFNILEYKIMDKNNQQLEYPNRDNVSLIEWLKNNRELIIIKTSV